MSIASNFLTTTKLVCDAYGIPVPKEGVATSAAEAAKIATDMGFPVVLKIVSPDILHKTEAGGVMAGVKTAADVEKNYATILANAEKYKPDAKIEGTQIEQMLLGGKEVIVGAVTDGSLGELVAFDLGGVLVEVLKDTTFRLAPATEEDALSMLGGIAGRQHRSRGGRRLSLPERHRGLRVLHRNSGCGARRQIQVGTRRGPDPKP
jgi:hypothetical protein